MNSITILRDDPYLLTRARVLTAGTPLNELLRLASDLTVYDIARVRGLRVAPETVPDEYVGIWWQSQVLSAHRYGILAVLEAQPLRQDWAPFWGAAVVIRDNMDRTNAILVGVRVLADPDLVASWSPDQDPETVLREMVKDWRPGMAV